MEFCNKWLREREVCWIRELNEGSNRWKKGVKRRDDNDDDVLFKNSKLRVCYILREERGKFFLIRGYFIKNLRENGS